MCVGDLVCDRSSSLTRGGGTIESAVSSLTIRRQYSSQIVTQTLSVKLDQHRANQAKLVSQLRLIHHHSPSHCICFSYSAEHSQVCVTVCLTHTQPPSRPAPSLPEALLGWLNPNETQILFVDVTTTQERSVLPDLQTFPLLAMLIPPRRKCECVEKCVDVQSAVENPLKESPSSTAS